PVRLHDPVYHGFAGQADTAPDRAGGRALTWPGRDGTARHPGGSRQCRRTRHRLSCAQPADHAGEGAAGDHREGGSTVKLDFILNGQSVSLDDVPTSATLLDVLRDHLKLTGTRLTCGIGMCGACTVLVDGEALSGCLLLVPMVAG